MSSICAPFQSVQICAICGSTRSSQIRRPRTSILATKNSSRSAPIGMVCITDKSRNSALSPFPCSIRNPDSLFLCVPRRVFNNLAQRIRTKKDVPADGTANRRILGSQAEPSSRLIRGIATPSVCIIRIYVEQQEGQNRQQKKEATYGTQPGLRPEPKRLNWSKQRRHSSFCRSRVASRRRALPYGSPLNCLSRIGAKSPASCAVEVSRIRP